MKQQTWLSSKKLSAAKIYPKYQNKVFLKWKNFSSKSTSFFTMIFYSCVLALYVLSRWETVSAETTRHCLSIGNYIRGGKTTFSFLHPPWSVSLSLVWNSISFRWSSITTKFLRRSVTNDCTSNAGKSGLLQFIPSSLPVLLISGAHCVSLIRLLTRDLAIFPNSYQPIQSCTGTPCQDGSRCLS